MQTDRSMPAGAAPPNRGAPPAVSRHIAGCIEVRLDPSRAIVLWVFRDYAGRWCIRQEGGGIEASLETRDEAIALARLAAEENGPYRLFFELKDGRFAEEYANGRDR